MLHNANAWVLSALLMGCAPAAAPVLADAAVFVASLARAHCRPGDSPESCLERCRAHLSAIPAASSAP